MHFSQFIPSTIQFITSALYFHGNLHDLYVVKHSLTIKLIKMEKLKFTIRFFTILLALPVVMFTELTRENSVNAQPKKVHETKITENTVNHSELVCEFSLLQAVYN